MNVLIVESRDTLGQVWARALSREGAQVQLASNQAEAASWLQARPFDVIVLDVVLDEGSALAVADYASYRQPEAKVVFVTDTSFFSDGTIFNYCVNAAACVSSGTNPEDIAALVEHHGRVTRP